MVVYIRLLSLSILVGLFLAAYGPVAYADYGAGKEVYDNHDYATAYKELIPMAKMGDARAMLVLGKMYRHGRGVKADVVMGTTWITKRQQAGLPLPNMTWGSFS